MRLIDAEVFVKELKKFLITIHQTYLAEAVLRIVQKVIDKQPTVEAKLVVHAHWVNYNNMFPCQCSNCNGFALSFDIGNYQKEIKSDFCPHCGAQMDEVVVEENATTTGVTIPVISMEDVPKIAKEMEK